MIQINKEIESWTDKLNVTLKIAECSNFSLYVNIIQNKMHERLHPIRKITIT